MAELVDALGLGSSEVTRGGSSPLSDTMKIIDNFLSEEDYEKLNTVIVKSDFEWGKSTILTGGRFQPHKIFNIQFVDSQIQQFNNELAVSDTARIAYTNALRNSLGKTK